MRHQPRSTNVKTEREIALARLTRILMEARSRLSPAAQRGCDEEIRRINRDIDARIQQQENL